MVMAGSVSGLRRRRRLYALAARRRALLQGPPFPTAFVLPGGRRLERQSYLFWRIRLPLWAALGGAGWLLAGVFGVVLGWFAAVLVEVAVSYRRPSGPPAVAVPRPPASPGGGGLSGVREPRRPAPTTGPAATSTRHRSRAGRR